MSGAAARTGDLKRKEEEVIIKRKWQVAQRHLKKNHCTRKQGNQKDHRRSEGYTTEIPGIIDSFCTCKYSLWKWNSMENGENTLGSIII